ncbi:branched-chain amino acid transport system II carrier protein [Candidatus Babeliales bacterium]|nr:branched-chain amino acid transport system II carrier protein [Candidatus Babeliales bacterium]MBP9844257.1 branched-chain amino acid transport system II carrier protein [Candidatus Babeliales bacterium]
MKDSNQSGIWTIGLAIFSMLFGAGNIMYPIKCGVVTGTQNYIGIMGFILTGVVLPIIGLIAMILFDGNYKKFFNRIGTIPGATAILYCMLIIGPLIAMPRCITVPFEMLAPFMSGISLPLFSVLFAMTAFLMTYKESKILSLLGNIVSPLLLGSLAIISIKGLWQADHMAEQSAPVAAVFFKQLSHGFQTLDLIGALFFAYIVLRILKSNRNSEQTKAKDLAIISLKSGLIAGILLMTVYLAFSYLGAFYGNLVTADMNGAEMFRIISLHILNKHSILIIMMAVLMACLSTITALAAVFAEYMHHELCNKKINYATCLAITMMVTTFISNFGLDKILYYSALPIDIGYPIIIAITLCNLAYSLFGIEYIKVPVAITAIITTSMVLYC